MPQEAAMYGTILVPVDGSPFSEQALDHAALVAQREGGAITLLSVILEFGQPVQQVPKLDQAAEQRAVDYLTSLEERVRAHGVPVSHMVRRGQPAPVIVATARDIGANLIVMASHGVGAAGPGMPVAGLGGVTFKVVYEAPCPLLVFPIRAPHAPAGVANSQATAVP
jgi:nucleotide-binding universal stress UspA family protein